MINYKELIENLQPQKIIDLMKHLGAEEYIENEQYIIFPTICHNENAEEASMKLYYYKNSHIFQCYTNCESQSIFSFLKHYYEVRDIEYDWYNDIYKLILDCSSYKESFGFETQKYKKIRDKYKKNKLQSIPTYPEGILKCFTKIYPVEWLMDNISKQAMDKYNILYSPIQNKIIIPHYNINNELVGIRGRALNEWEIENIGKYMPIQIEGKWYSHPLSLNLYGLNKTKKNIQREGYCIIYEAEKSVLQSESFSRPNCSVAVCGSQLNKYSLKLLLRICHPKEIIIAFDNEEEPGSDKYFNKLNNICKKYSNYCNFSFIYNRNNLMKPKDSPSDNGEEIFEELLKRRHIVK